MLAFFNAAPVLAESGSQNATIETAKDPAPPKGPFKPKKKIFHVPIPQDEGIERPTEEIPYPDESAGPVKVRSVRFGMNKDGIRIVVDLSGRSNFQVHSIKDSSKIYLDIFDAELPEKFRLPNRRPDKLLRNCIIRQYNPRQVRMTINLKYGIPVDNVDVIKLKNPDRIVIDLFREYHNFIQFHITKNIVWLQTERASNGRFTLINELYVNHKSPDVNVDVKLAKHCGKSREKVTNIVKKTNAIAGVNGGYFSKSGVNLGLVVIDGKIVASSVKRRPPRTAFGITFDKKVLFNRVVDKNGKLKVLWGKPWKSVITALGAGPRLISNGKVHITAKQEGLAKGGNDITRRTGRTALGVTKDGNLVFFTFSGFRSNNKDGAQLGETARYLKSRNIVNAMNLDGGGSTAMSIMGYLVSKPPGQGKWQRPVANGIMVYDKSPVISPCYIGMEPTAVVLPADGRSVQKVRILVCDRNEMAVPDKTPVAVVSGVGLITKKYYYTKNGLVDIKIKSARAPGNYSIKLECGPLRTFLPVKFTAGEPSDLSAIARPVKISRPSKNNKKYIKTSRSGDSKKFIAKKGTRFLVKALVRDKYRNPLKGQVVKFEVVEGKGKFSTKNGITKPNGVADSTFILLSKYAKIKISSKDMEPVFMEFGGVSRI